MKLLAHSSQIITVNTDGKNCKRGNELGDIGVLTEHAIVVENDTIKDLIPNFSIKNTSKYDIIDLQDKVILPGLVECHTHTAFAGSRANEFRQKINGVHYEEIAKSGGGINTTVKAVRESSFNRLINIITPRIEDFI